MVVLVHQIIHLNMVKIENFMLYIIKIRCKIYIHIHTHICSIYNVYILYIHIHTTFHVKREG